MHAALFLNGKSRIFPFGIAAVENSDIGVALSLKLAAQEKAELTTHALAINNEGGIERQTFQRRGLLGLHLVIRKAAAGWDMAPIEFLDGSRVQQRGRFILLNLDDFLQRHKSRIGGLGHHLVRVFGGSGRSWPTAVPGNSERSELPHKSSRNGQPQNNQRLKKCGLNVEQLLRAQLWQVWEPQELERPVVS